MLGENRHIITSLLKIRMSTIWPSKQFIIGKIYIYWLPDLLLSTYTRLVFLHRFSLLKWRHIQSLDLFMTESSKEAWMHNILSIRDVNLGPSRTKMFWVVVFFEKISCLYVYFDSASQCVLTTTNIKNWHICTTLFQSGQSLASSDRPVWCMICRRETSIADI